VDNKEKFELKNSALDLDLVKFMVDLLSSFQRRTLELRHCNRHATVNHVLLCTTSY